VTSLLTDVFGDVGERLPDVDEVRGTAPMSGGAAAALVVGLVLARVLHIGGWGQSQTEAQTEEALAQASSWRRQLRDVDLQSARKKVPNVDIKAARSKVPKVDTSGVRSRAQSVSPRPMGLGLGGILGVAAAVFLILRLLRGGGRQKPSNWYYGDERREEVPNQ
jgi:hypothetical protein